MTKAIRSNTVTHALTGHVSNDGQQQRSGQFQDSILIDSAHRFAAQAIVSPTEQFKQLLRVFLQDLLLETQDDDAIVLSVSSDQPAVTEASAGGGFDDATWHGVESCFGGNATDLVVVITDTEPVESATDVIIDPQLCKRFRERGIRSLLAVALMGRGDLRGVLILARCQSIGEWDDSRLDQLREVSSVIGSVLAHRRTEKLLEGALRRNRRLSQQLVEIQEQERRRLAQELHDETGQYLAALKSDASLVGRRLPPGDDILRRSAEAVVSTADHIYEVVYGVMGRLCAVDLDDLGLTGALEACVTNSGLENNGVNCALSTAGELDSLDDTISMTVYRIVQESLTNISKYADAQNVNVSVERAVKTLDDRRQLYREQSQTTDKTTANASSDQIHIDTLEILVSDDGCGIKDTDSKGGGFGIRGMRERLQALGGSLNVTSEPGQGTRVRGVLPLGASQDKGVQNA